LFGSTHATRANDMEFRANGNIWMQWDESVGDLEILTGIGAKTAALTIDSSQGATFAGAFTSLGIDDNATGTRLTLTDAFAIIGGSGATYEIIRGGSAGSLEISGSTGSDSGGNIELFGSTHATRANDMEFRANGNIWMQWDESVGDLEILTGTGAKTSSVTFQANGQIGLGPAGTSGYNIIRNSSTAGITISGGSSAALGGNIFLLGETHASLPGDILFRSGINSFMVWDESVGDLEILTGTGVKTSALTIDAVQNSVFGGVLSLSKGADIASATTLVLGTDGNYFDVTGTVTITGIGTKGSGTVVTLHFDGALTLTHHATNLILPGGVDIVTVAGDEATFVEYATGDWRCSNYEEYASGYSTGAFNPALTPATSGSITLFTNQDELYYVKIGKLVFIQGQLSINTLTSPVGNLTMTGLPFTSATETDTSSAGIAIVNNTVGACPTHGTMVGIINSGGTTMNIYEQGLTGVASINTATDLAQSDQFIFSFHYMTDN